MTTPPPRSAEYFDGWYADMARSPVKDEIEQRHLGLPPYLLSTSMLTWDGIADVAASVQGLLCVDAVQFAEPQAGAYAEIRRVLAPGGRAVLTCWEPRDATDERLPARLRTVDLAAGLSGAGFVEVEVVERADWDTVEHAMWTEAAGLEPGEGRALRSFHDEGLRSLATHDLRRRVLATATAPG